jgi:hypothetical protein
MSTVEILFRYSTPPTSQTALALARTLEVYGIRRLCFNRAARTLRIEYDATRLNPAAVANLMRQAGLDIAPETQPAIAIGTTKISPPAPLPTTAV